MSNINIRKVKDAVTKEEFYPQTCIEAVVDENGETLGIDASPTDDSDKLVRSGGVKAAIDNEATARANADSALGIRIDGANTGIQAAMAAVSAEQQRAVQAENAKYVKPAGGIPKVDLASDVQASLELAQDVVYDISAHNNNTAYADLAAALGSGGANVPQSLRKGGMSVRFVQTYDNKYVQYRLMKNQFSTTPADWQGVDKVPAAGSENLVESGGVFDALNGAQQTVTQNDVSSTTLSRWINNNGKVASSSSGVLNRAQMITIVPGKYLTLEVNLSYADNPAAFICDDDDNILVTVDRDGTTTSYSGIVPSGGTRLYISYATTFSVTLVKNVGKQDKLTFDDVPVDGSNNPVKSGGVFDSVKAVDDKADANTAAIEALESATSDLVLRSQPNGSIKADKIKWATSVDFKADIGDSVIISFTGSSTVGIRFIAVDNSSAVQYLGSQSSVFYTFEKQIKSVLVVYGDITNVDIKLVKLPNEKLLLSGTYFNGALKRAEQHDCNINANSTVYVHLEGEAGTALNFLHSDGTGRYITISQGDTSIDTSIVLAKPVAKIQAAYGNLTNCTLTSKEKDWSSEIAVLTTNVNNLNDYVDNTEKGKEASVIESTLSRGVAYPFFASAGDKISYQFSGSSGTALQLRKGDSVKHTITISNGNSPVSGVLTLNSDIDSINAAYGDLTSVEVVRTEAYIPYNEIGKISAENGLCDSVLPSGNSQTLTLSSSDFENGNIDSDGNPQANNSCLRLISYRRVVQNSKISVSIASGFGIRVFFWDSNYHFVSRSDRTDGTTGTVVIPDKAAFIKVVINKLDGTSMLPSGFWGTNTIITLLNSPMYVPAAPMRLSELGRKEYAGSLARAAEVPFYANAGDKLHIKFEGSAGTELRFMNGTKYVHVSTIPTGNSKYEDTILLNDNINNMLAAYGDLSYVELYSEECGIHQLPINAPSIQKPANSDTDSDFNAESITIEELYAGFDGIIAKIPGTTLPKYMTKHNIEGNVTPCPKPVGEQSEAEIASSALKIRTYVLTKKNRYAWIASYPRYAWKNTASNTIVFTLSCCPRVGDTLENSDGLVVSSYSPSTGIIASDSSIFERHDAMYYKGEIIFTQAIYNGNLDVFDNNDQKLGTSTYIDATHRSYNNMTYERIESLDYHTDNKATIFIWANEHGAQSDPYEGSIISYRLARDLCYAVDNPMLNYLRNYCKVIIIPCANPYSMNMRAATGREGRTNANNVNINRNYDTPGWEVVTDSNKGSAAGSENETQYIMNMVRFFKPDVAIDIHVLGYVTAANEGKCHYEGHTPGISYINKISSVMSAYGLSFITYGDANPDTGAQGPDWLYYNNIAGGLIEMNAGAYASAYDGNQHTDWMLQADYTLLLNTLWMWYKEYDPVFSLVNIEVTGLL